MSVRRLALTVTALALIGVLLTHLTPALGDMARVLGDAQRTADTEGVDVVVTSAAGLLAWAVWLWGAAGLALTALTALPGAAGGAARVLVRLVLPGGARRGAAVLLGLGLAVTGPAIGVAVVAFPVAASAAGPSPDAGALVPDWPVAVPAAGPVPDWPAQPAGARPAAPAGAYVVLRGDCLWDIAAARLRDTAGRSPTDGEIAAAAHAWWTANEAVIGADPDLLLPGQVLVPPDAP